MCFKLSGTVAVLSASTCSPGSASCGRRCRAASGPSMPACQSPRARPCCPCALTPSPGSPAVSTKGHMSNRALLPADSNARIDTHACMHQGLWTVRGRVSATPSRSHACAGPGACPLHMGIRGPGRTLLRCCHRPCCWRSGSPMIDVGTVSTTTRFARCAAASMAAQ